MMSNNVISKVAWSVLLRELFVVNGTIKIHCHITLGKTFTDYLTGGRYRNVQKRMNYMFTLAAVLSALLFAKLNRNNFNKR